MSSNIRITRICRFCRESFTARTTVTKFCSHRCSSRAYKQRERDRNVEKSVSETLPLSSDAVSILPDREEDSQRVFKGLKYYQTKHISDWMLRAGIKRRITFHAFRHTFATLQLTLGTDIYTVSKLLGHKNLHTTQIYARVIDEKKQEAVNRIKLR